MTGDFCIKIDGDIICLNPYQHKTAKKNRAKRLMIKLNLCCISLLRSIVKASIFICSLFRVQYDQPSQIDQTKSHIESSFIQEGTKWKIYLSTICMKIVQEIKTTIDARRYSSISLLQKTTSNALLHSKSSVSILCFDFRCYFLSCKFVIGFAWARDLPS